MDTTNRELETSLGRTGLGLGVTASSLARGRLATRESEMSALLRAYCLKCGSVRFALSRLQFSSVIVFIQHPMRMHIPFLIIGEVVKRVEGLGGGGG